MTDAEFEEWLSRLPLRGTRGFRDSDVRKAHGPAYLKELTRWIAKGWIAHRGGTEVWWISSAGEDALLGRSE